MADHRSHTHYTRRPSTSLSPTVPARSVSIHSSGGDRHDLMGTSMGSRSVSGGGLGGSGGSGSMGYDHGLGRREQASPPPRAISSSRMSLSALVNSPPHSPVRVLHREIPVSPPRRELPVHRSPSPPSVIYGSSRPAYSYGHHGIEPRGPLQPSWASDARTSSYPRHAAVPPDVGRSYLSQPGSRDVMERSYSNRSYESAQDYDDYEFRERDRLHSRGQEVDDRSFPAGSASMSHSDLPQSPEKKAAATSAAASASAVARSGTYWVNGNGNGNGHDEPVEEATPQEEKPDPTPRAMRFSDNLTGSEDVWEEPLKRYQLKREKEAAEIEAWDPATAPAGGKKPRPRKSAAATIEVDGQSQADSAMTEDTKPSKRKGWPSDHPTRIAQREAKEAMLAAGMEVPKRKYKRKPKIATIEDELLGLAEGDEGRSSPAPPSEGIEADEDAQSVKGEKEDVAPEEPVGPDSIVYPCGLTRTEVIRRVEKNDLRGLTETDVKAVQDEMWIRQFDPDALKGGMIRKDGTIRKKPGPAKGWKKMRRDLGMEAGSARGDDSDGESMSHAGETANGEADADIEALLEGDAAPERTATSSSTKRGGKAKAKRRKLDEGDEVTRYASENDSRMGLDDEDDERRSSVVDGLETGTGTGGKKHKSKAREPGVGKGKWTRPTKPEKEMLKKAEALAVQNVMQSAADTTAGTPEEVDASAAAAAAAAAAAGGQEAAVELVSQGPAPNTEDPRGVSEAEARVRLGLVEDLQRQAWQSIVRDIPRMYRVYQAYDSVVKQDSLRKAQAAVRNAFSQRSMKPTFRSTARINKDAGTKARKVIKEMLLYWRKNEKDELAARKKAEKEALDKAKAEEEAREAKRQSRKLNFLLTQTELYSHFIGKKIKTAEAERGDADTAVDAPPPRGAEHANEELGLDDEGEPLPDIDYDDDDEENLRKHAARGAQAAINAARDKAKAFDAARAPAPAAQADEPIDLDGDELNFQNPSLGEDALTITQPKMLMAQLKEYQLKGLTWLGNLYEQGINGILADEMGLGKTIQSISLLAFLAEHHNLWGPFLVIAPSSTLHNWQQELARFVPRLKALPYWGSPKDRETLRRIWCRKNMTFNEQSPFHILVTSYQLAVQDEKYLNAVTWQYMVLDEAQAIKSSSSARWKSLLSLKCRNRLLLTGTPIQNSMHELWALLHFIMPSLFDSHEEFSEWFSKDIENAAGGGGGQLKPEQLRRLHMILKPFMLRRVKKHVQKELGDKIEIDVLVDLSQRQRAIYKALRQRVSVSDLIAQANNLADSAGAKNLMNLVMQFRKVCNHPDLFERADVVSPFMFGSFAQSGNLARQGDLLYLPDSARNAIEVDIPRLVWDDKLDRPGEENRAGDQGHVLKNLMSIWRTDWINESIKEEESRWGFLRIMGKTPGQAVKEARGHPLVKLLRDSEAANNEIENGPFESDESFTASTSHKFTPLAPRVPSARTPTETPLRDITLSAWNNSYLSRTDARFALEHAVAPFIRPAVSARSYVNTQTRLSDDPLVRKAVYGVTPSERDDPSAVSLLSEMAPGVPPIGLLAAGPKSESPIPSLRVPPIKRLIVDSAKLARLDELLRELKDGGHRVLLYFQMTKMMDLVEEYLIYRQYKYLRLDGSSAIGDRRDMVTSWQTNPDIFVFCLSTRAGGLGINLTAADTVIFYDHDWNPSNDAQAMDRAHRVGQTKQVTVYRLIARGTIEERIVTLARAKKDVQDIVVGTKSLTDVAKPSEIVSLFMDDEELAESVAKRKQAEAHGYVAPSINAVRPRSAFGDGLGGGDDDEDDFFSLAKKPANNEDEDFGDEARSKAVATGAGAGAGEGGNGGGKKKKSGGSKRKAPPGEGGEEGEKKPPAKKKKVKIALGPDGLPI